MDPVDIADEWVDVDFDEFEPGSPQFAGNLDHDPTEQTFGISWPDTLQ